MAASFTNSLDQEDTESPSAQLLGEGSPPQGSESAAGDTSTTDPNLSPSKRKGGRLPVDNSEETKERHAELYQYYKANSGLSQAKMAEWYSTKFGSTMSQCTVSQVLKKQKLLNGEEIAEPRPRKRKSLKAEELGGESKPKKQRGNDAARDGTPIGGAQTVIYTPNSFNPPSFQAVNAPNHGSYSTFASPATPVSLAHAALSHSETMTPATVPFRATDPSRTNQQPFSTGPNARPVAPMLHSGGVMLDQTPHPRPENVQAVQAELENTRRTVSEYQKIVQKQETLIDNILTNQQSEKDKIKTLESENILLRERKGNEHISELLNKIEKLTRDLENERDRNRSMVELWAKEEQQLKDLLATRSSKFPLGADMK